LHIAQPDDARTWVSDLRREVAGINELDFRRELLRGYAPQPIGRGLGTLEVFQTADRFAGTVEGRSFDWGRLAPQRSAHHVVPGRDAGSMVGAGNAGALARLLAERLRIARDEA